MKIVIWKYTETCSAFSQSLRKISRISRNFPTFQKGIYATYIVMDNNSVGLRWRIPSNDYKAGSTNAVVFTHYCQIFWSSGHWKTNKSFVNLNKSFVNLNKSFANRKYLHIMSFIRKHIIPCLDCGGEVTFQVYPNRINKVCSGIVVYKELLL